MVVHDAEGLISGAAMESFPGSFSPLRVEAIVFHHALETALNWNFTWIIVGGDAK